MPQIAPPAHAAAAWTASRIAKRIIAATCIAAICLVALVALVACASPASTPAWNAGTQPAASRSASTSADPKPSPSPSAKPSAPSAKPSAPSLITTARLGAAKKLIDAAPGTMGIIVYDRQSGKTYREGVTTHLTWTASTIKLAIVTELLEKQRAGDITLSSGDRADIADILNWSSDDAATALWKKYGASALVPRMRKTYGMTTLTFIDGYTKFWGHMKCTAEDLMHLIKYVIGTLDSADRAYLVNAMRHVGSIQRWGVWAAGASLSPGAKDGWSIESDDGAKHWVTNSVGFAGDGQRYLVALMYQLPPGKQIGDGVHAVSDVVATVFGAKTPAKVTVPDPSTGL